MEASISGRNACIRASTAAENAYGVNETGCEEAGEVGNARAVLGVNSDGPGPNLGNGGSDGEAFGGDVESEVVIRSMSDSTTILMASRVAAKTTYGVAFDAHPLLLFQAFHVFRSFILNYGTNE